MGVEKIIAEKGVEVVAKKGSELVAEQGSELVAEEGIQETAGPLEPPAPAEKGVEVVAKKGSELVAKTGSELVAEEGSEVVAKEGAELVAEQGSELVAEEGIQETAGPLEPPAPEEENNGKEETEKKPESPAPTSPKPKREMGNWLADSYAELTSKFATRKDYEKKFEEVYLKHIERVRANFSSISPTPPKKEILVPEKNQGSPADSKAKATEALDKVAGSVSVAKPGGPK